MSKENLEQFMSKVADSEELQAKIGEEIDAEALIALGAECGCEFTAEELQEAAELSDDELDEVAGGITTAQAYKKKDLRPGPPRQQVYSRRKMQCLMMSIWPDYDSKWYDCD